jgi:hypothetical protein
MKSESVIAFLLGTVLSLAGALAFSYADTPVAHAESGVGGSDMFAVVGNGYQGQSRDVIFVIDAGTRRMAVYEFKNGKLALGAVRNVKWDLKFEEWSSLPQRPSVKDMRKAILDLEKKKG